MLDTNILIWALIVTGGTTDTIVQAWQKRAYVLLTLSHLPPYDPELNSMENVWEYLRGNKLSRLVWESYDAIVAAREEGWDFLINDPDRIRSIGHRDWA
jgi:predicted nucleic acid-binding protein